LVYELAATAKSNHINLNTIPMAADKEMNTKLVSSGPSCLFNQSSCCT